MSPTDDIPRRRLLQPLLDLLTRRRTTHQPTAPTPTAPQDDFGDDLIGIYTPEPRPTPTDPVPPDDTQDPDDTDYTDWADETENECVFDGAPYYGPGVMGRYCSWPCADADESDPDLTTAAETDPLTNGGPTPPTRISDDPWDSGPPF